MEKGRRKHRHKNKDKDKNRHSRSSRHAVVKQQTELSGLRLLLFAYLYLYEIMHEFYPKLPRNLNVFDLSIF